MVKERTYEYSEFLDAWENIVSPPPLRDQLDELIIHADAQRVMTPASRAIQLEDFHSLMSYRHIFS